MQAVEIKTFDDYWNNQDVSRANMERIREFNHSQNVGGMTQGKNTKRKTDIKHSTKKHAVSRQNEHNRRVRRFKLRMIRLSIVLMFFLIIYVGIHMISYIVGNMANRDGRSSDGYELLSDEAGVDSSYDKTEYTGDWKLIVVNKNNPIPDNYDIELTTLSNGVKVDSRIYPDLQRMFDDMRAQGIYPVVGEGYRTHEQQEKMMQDKIDAFRAEGYSKKEAKRLAKDWVAVPGTSEHELGIALDINAATDSSTTHEEVYQWLYDNAYLYGFILRYPEGKEDITGIDYEPWHYRYVGGEAARQIYEGGLTLEEYTAK